jgi:hypothetical protein
MKKYLLAVLFFLMIVSTKAADKDSTVYYNLPDSVKAVQFMVEVKIETQNEKKYCEAQINVGPLSFSIWANNRKDRHFSFNCHPPTEIVGMGHDVSMLRGPAVMKGMYFFYRWKYNLSYKLLIAEASDSATMVTLYSGYVWLPEESKWKLIGTFRVGNYKPSLTNLSTYFAFRKKAGVKFIVSQVWAQRSNGSWKNLKDEKLPSPTINLFGHVDSVQQHQTDIKLIEDAIASGKIDTKNIEQGVYYSIMKEGTGRQVSVNDTLTVNYRLRLLNDTTIIQETKDKPATFPLKRLIKGWQIGVPLCKVGGKIKLVLPSELAYSIRTRAADIPPNSILVFEIEVLDAKSPL